MPLSKIHNTLTSDHILLDGTDSTGANANSSVLLDSSAANTDVGSLMSYEAGAVDGAVTLPVGRNDLSLIIYFFSPYAKSPASPNPGIIYD